MKIHIYTYNRHIGMGVLSYSAHDGHFRLSISSDSHNLSEVVSESQIRTLESEHGSRETRHTSIAQGTGHERESQGHIGLELSRRKIPL